MINASLKIYCFYESDFGTVPPELMTAFQIIPYQSAEYAVFKALGIE